MTSDDRMVGCICASGAKVAEIVHPYCPAHVPPEMEAELASLRAELAATTEAMERLEGLDAHVLATLPYGPDDGTEDESDAWECVDYAAGEIKALRAEVERLKEERATFVAAANDLAGVSGWAWTAALAHAISSLKSRPVGVPDGVRETLSSLLTERLSHINGMESDGHDMVEESFAVRLALAWLADAAEVATSERDRAIVDVVRGWDAESLEDAESEHGRPRLASLALDLAAAMRGGGK